MNFCTVVNCMDGRVQLPVIRYLQDRFNVEYVDSVTEPGPNLLLAERTHEDMVQSILRRIRISVEKHSSVAIALAGHHECAGNPAAMMAAIKSVRRGGTVMLFSVPETDAVLDLPAFNVFFRELKILGSFTNPATQGRAVDLISTRKIQLEPLISHQLPLESIEQAFKMFGKAEALKIVVNL